MLLRNLGRLSAAIAAVAMAVLSPLLSASAAAQPDARPPEQPIAPSSNAPETTTPIHAVSLRAGPNGAAPVIGVLHPGTPVRVIGSASYGWMQVISPEGNGWAYGSYFANGVSRIARSDIGGIGRVEGGSPPLGIASP